MGLGQVLTEARFAIGRRGPVGRTSARRMRHVMAGAAAGDRRRLRDAAASPRHLHHAERSRHSQNGEDGVIAEILRRIGADGRTFVEIGAADGSENCTRALLQDGWSGVWVEGNAADAAAARAVVGDRPVTVVEAFVDRDDVVARLRAAGAPAEPTVLVIDVDGNDWWLWRALSTQMRPALVVVEYNSVIGPRISWRMPYDPAHRWDGSMRFGVSLAAWVALASRLGYVLVGCDSTGTNAFFVPERLAADRFDEAPAHRHYVRGHSIVVAHPWRRRDELVAAPLSDDRALTLTVDRTWTATSANPSAGAPLYVTAWVTNGSEEPIGDPALTPVRLTWRWRGDTSEPRRGFTTPWRLQPGERNLLGCRVTTPTRGGRHELELGLVQEGVRWFGGAARVSLPVVVEDTSATTRTTAQRQPTP